MSNEVAYLYNQEITKYQFSKEHPMKTKRIKMANSLIYSYGLDKKLDIYHFRQATSKELESFHHPHYVRYLETWVNPLASKTIETYYCNTEDHLKARQDPRMHSIFKINQNLDNPGFEGLYNFCQLAAGSSIDAADLIITQEASIAINWAGGFHHGKKTQASGFCYINDIVLCILELLKVYPRVLYLDIDVHHGDGVEEAFYHTNRVMTVSFHEYAEDFFPGTGSLAEVGQGIGKYFTVNVPLKRGIDDITYLNLFRKVMQTVMVSFRPDALVIQCGADSLSKDKLGHLNLSIRGHAQAINYMRSFGVPMVLLGGGGYTIQNTSRCWAYETGMVMKYQIDNEIPTSDVFYKYYDKEDYKIHFDVEKQQNQNDNNYLNSIVETITENLREAEMRPSISFHVAPKHFIPTEDIDCEVISDSDDNDKKNQTVMLEEGREKLYRRH